MVLTGIVTAHLSNELLTAVAIVLGSLIAIGAFMSLASMTFDTSPRMDTDEGVEEEPGGLNDLEN